jgi:hypothetical protein
MPATKRNNGLKGSGGAQSPRLPPHCVAARQPLRSRLPLLAEFMDVKAEAHDGLENDSSNFNIGAYLSF